MWIIQERKRTGRHGLRRRQDRGTLGYPGASYLLFTTPPCGSLTLTENKNRASFIREPVIEASLGKQCLVHLVMRPQLVLYKEGRKTHNACWPSWSDSAPSFARVWLAYLVRKMAAYCHRISFYRETYCVKLGEDNFRNARLLIPKCAFFELGTT